MRTSPRILRWLAAILGLGLLLSLQLHAVAEAAASRSDFASFQADASAIRPHRDSDAHFLAVLPDEETWTFSGSIHDPEGRVPENATSFRMRLSGGTLSGPQELLWGTVVRPDGTFRASTSAVYSHYFIDLIASDTGYEVVSVQPGPNGTALGLSTIWYAYIDPGAYGDNVFVVSKDPLTPTPTPTETPTSPPPTNTPTRAPTRTPPPTPTATATDTPTDEPTATPTSTDTPLPTETPTDVPTETPTATSTSTRTRTPTPRPTWTPTRTLTPTSTATPMPTATSTDLPTSTPTQRPQPPTAEPPTAVPPTWTPTPTLRPPTATLTATVRPTLTSTATRTTVPSPTVTPTVAIIWLSPTASPQPATQVPTWTPAPTWTPTILPTVTPSYTPWPTPSQSPSDKLPGRVVVALQDRPSAVPAGDDVQLTLVARNDGDLPSDSVSLSDVLPVEWAITGASATRGLVSIDGSSVRVRLGVVGPGEQIIVLLTVRAPDAPPKLTGEHCVVLSAGTTSSELCGPLPEVLDSVAAGSRLPSEGAGGALAKVEPILSILGEADSQLLSGRLGRTLVINSGSSIQRNAYLHIKLDDDCRLSDGLTTMGLLSVVDHTVVVRLGRLDPNAVIAVTLVGTVTEDNPGEFCATLVADGVVYRHECGRLRSQ